MPIDSYTPTVRPPSYDLIDQAFDRFVQSQTQQNAQTTAIPDFFKKEGQTPINQAPDQPFTPPTQPAPGGNNGGSQGGSDSLLALLGTLLGQNQGGERTKIPRGTAQAGPGDQQAYFNQANPWFQLQSQFTGQPSPVADIFNIGNYQRSANAGGVPVLNDQTRQQALTYILQRLAGGGGA